jgi:hypothetical protein
MPRLERFCVTTLISLEYRYTDPTSGTFVSQRRLYYGREDCKRFTNMARRDEGGVLSLDGGGVCRLSIVLSGQENVRFSKKKKERKGGEKKRKETNKGRAVGDGMS